MSMSGGLQAKASEYDLYKEDPGKADFIIAQWRKTGQSKAQEWIIRHGRRNQE